LTNVNEMVQRSWFAFECLAPRLHVVVAVHPHDVISDAVVAITSVVRGR